MIAMTGHKRIFGFMERSVLEESRKYPSLQSLRVQKRQETFYLVRV